MTSGRQALGEEESRAVQLLERGTQGKRASAGGVGLGDHQIRSHREM